MVVKNITRLEVDDAYKFLYDAAKKSQIKRFIFPLVLLLMGIIIIIMTLVNKDLDSYFQMGCVFSAVAIGFFIYNLYLIARLSKTIVKKNPEIMANGLTNEFIFKEESFSVVSRAGNLVNKYSSSYKDLNKIIKREDHFVFIIDSTSFLIARNDGFKNSKELEQFIYGLSKHKIKIKDK